MGGFGSGKRGGRQCTDDMQALDVRQIHRAGLLTPGRTYSWQWSRDGVIAASIRVQVEADRVLLDYRNRCPHRNDGDWGQMNYAVRLAFTPCGFGGQRVWWRCPVVSCRRRVAVLHGGRVFACRQCNRLAYRSQREKPNDRAIRRADLLRERLGWLAGILNAEGGKPKGMHWRTYRQFHGQHEDLRSRALAGMAAKLGLLPPGLAALDRQVVKLPAQ